MARVYEDSGADKIKLFEYGERYDRDETDEKVLWHLHNNCRQSLASMSRKSGLTRDVIGYRIKRMVEENLVLGFRPVFNPPKLGFPVINHVYFLLQPQNIEQEKKFASYLKAMPKVVTVNSLVGKWEYMIKVIAKDPSDFNDTLKKIRMKFPDLIRDFETMSVLEEYKHENYQGLFE